MHYVVLKCHHKLHCLNSVYEMSVFCLIFALGQMYTECLFLKVNLFLWFMFKYRTKTHCAVLIKNLRSRKRAPCLRFSDFVMVWMQYVLSRNHGLWTSSGLVICTVIFTFQVLLDTDRRRISWECAGKSWCSAGYCAAVLGCSIGQICPMHFQLSTFSTTDGLIDCWSRSNCTSETLQSPDLW